MASQQTYWVPIPIQRAPAPPRNPAPAPLLSSAPATPSWRKPSAGSAPAASSLAAPHLVRRVQQDELFPRKRKSDLYGEIESRKYLTK